MPLSINVGLSRKASRDFQSTGYSINVTAELDQTLLAKPDELQRQVDDLFSQAQSALDRQAGAENAPLPTPDRPRRAGGGNGYVGRSANGNARYARNGNGNGHANGARGRGGDAPATASQRRAITSIADRLNVDADYEAREIVGAGMDELTLRQASELIDHLKSLQPADAGHNGR